MLLEAIRRGTAPEAILVTARETFFALASIVAAELYGTSIPILTIDQNEFGRLETGDRVHVQSTGRISVTLERTD
jgi:predicted aconitase with swiveling domain